MLRSMSSAISGMQAFQTDLDVVGNNIANVNTVGFKSSRADFSDILSQTVSGGNAGTKPTSTTAGTGGAGGTNPQQVGLGVQVADTELNFSQGSDSTTSNPTDLSINGAGLFVVSTDGGTSYNYTRAGNFTVDSSGNLVLPNGAIAYGYTAKPTSANATTVTPPAAASTYSGAQAININTLSSNTAATAPDAQIGSDGSISIATTSGSRKTIGYLALANFSNTAGLKKQGDSMFSSTSASGPPTFDSPGQSNLGTTISGQLEQSNVDLAQQFSEMIVAQNGFVANTHMIGTDNQVLQALVSMKNG